MKRKIIITESQYNKLQEFLFETTDVNHTLDFVNVGDVLNFKTSAGSNYTINVKNVDQRNNEILGDNQGNKIRFTFNSYDEQTKKFNFQELDKKTQKYINKEEEFTELDIKRNGQVVQIPDVGGNKQPGQQPEQEPVGQPESKPVGQPDEIAKTIELDPNATIVNKEEGYDDEDYKEMIDNIEAEYESDDIFRQALFKQRNFFERLTGINPDGHGIIIANKLVNSNRDKGSNNLLKANFIKGNKALFKPLQKYNLEYEVDGKIENIEFNGEREAKVGNANLNNQRKLTDVNKNFEILVTKNISTEKIPNYFLCYISTYSTIKGNKIKNKSVPVKLQFLDSTGFNVKNI